jgi:hypothetical protein
MQAILGAHQGFNFQVLQLKENTIQFISNQFYISCIQELDIALAAYIDASISSHSFFGFRLFVPLHAHFAIDISYSSAQI